jgi:hypothetical protein
MAGNTVLKGLARVLDIRRAPTTIIALEVLATGARVEWRPNRTDFSVAQYVAPFHIGSQVTLNARCTAAGRLMLVRYTCDGRTFRGLAAHGGLSGTAF